MFKKGDLITINGMLCVMVMIDEDDLRLIGRDDWNRWDEVNWYGKDISELEEHFERVSFNCNQIQYSPIGDEE